MKEYQKRVIHDRKSLSEKLDKLHIFLNSPVFKSTRDKMSGIDLSLMRIQSKLMEMYLEVLDARISRFVE